MGKVLKNKGAIAILAVIPVVLILISLAVFSILPKSSLISIDGDVEITTVPYYSKVTGEVTEIFFEMGETVSKGQVVAIIDNKVANNKLQELEELLIMKEAKLSQVINDTNNSGIDAARNVAKSNIAIYEEKVNMAIKSLENAKKDLEIQKALYEAEAISLSELESFERKVTDEESLLSISKSELNSAKENLATITYPKNDEAIKLAEADVRLAKLQKEQLEDSMKDYEVVANEKGVLIEQLIEEGSFVATGQKIIELSKEGEKHFVFYLPEEYIEFINYGDEIRIKPLATKKVNEEYIGKVDYIDYKAIYTPKDNQAASNKNKRSMKIKAILHKEANLRAGERARIQINTNPNL